MSFLSFTTVMAQSYLMRVREALVAQDPATFKKFLFILNEFTENSEKSPIQLYNQLCEVSAGVLPWQHCPTGA